MAAGFLNQFAQAVQMAAGTMVMNRDYRIVVAFSHGTNHVRYTFLHLRIGTLHGIELDSIGILSGFDRRYGTATHADAVVVTAHHDNLLTGLRSALKRILAFAKTYAAGQHDYLVVTIFLFVLLMFKGEQRTANQRLSELVAEIAGAVRSLDKNLLRSLVEPLTLIHGILTRMLLFITWIRGHIDGRTSNGQRSRSTSKTVADFTTGTSCRTVKRLDCCGEVMGLSLQRNDRLNVLYLKIG